MSIWEAEDWAKLDWAYSNWAGANQANLDWAKFKLGMRKLGEVRIGRTRIGQLFALILTQCQLGIMLFFKLVSTLKTVRQLTAQNQA